MTASRGPNTHRVPGRHPADASQKIPVRPTRGVDEYCGTRFRSSRREARSIGTQPSNLDSLPYGGFRPPIGVEDCTPRHVRPCAGAHGPAVRAPQPGRRTRSVGCRRSGAPVARRAASRQATAAPSPSPRSSGRCARVARRRRRSAGRAPGCRSRAGGSRPGTPRSPGTGRRRGAPPPSGRRQDRPLDIRPHVFEDLFPVIFSGDLPGRPRPAHNRLARTPVFQGST